MGTMASNKDVCRRILLNEFHSGRTASAAYRHQCEVMGAHAYSRTTVYDWYSKFQKGDFSLTNEPHPSRESPIMNRRVLSALHKNPDVSVRGLSKKTNVSRSSVHRILKRAGKVAKKPGTVPHDLTLEQRHERIAVSTMHLHRKRTTNWIYQIVAQDEKWVSYDNPIHSLVWVDANEKPEPRPKRKPYCKKDMLSFFFCSSGAIFWELIPGGSTVTAQVMCTHLEKMVHQIHTTCPQHGNILLLFWKRGIDALPDRWQKVIDAQGKYF